MIIPIIVDHERKSGSGTRRQKPKQRPVGKLLPGSPSVGCLVCLLMQFRMITYLPSGGTAKHGLDPLTSSINQKNAPQACLQSRVCGVVSRGPSSQIALACVKLTKAQARHSPAQLPPNLLEAFTATTLTRAFSPDLGPPSKEGFEGQLVNLLTSSLRVPGSGKLINLRLAF